MLIYRTSLYLSFLYKIEFFILPVCNIAIRHDSFIEVPTE